jgi:hypothetical protein
MAMFVVPMSIVFSVLPLLMVGVTEKTFLCNMLKDMTEFGGSGSGKSICNAKKSADQCYNGCEWKEGACDEFGVIMLKKMTNPDAGSPAAVMMDQAIACNKYSKAACTVANCKVNDAGMCDIADAFHKTYACDNAGSIEMMKVAVTCAAKAKDACTGDCEFKDQEGKCDVSPAKFYETMFGSSAATKMMGLMQTMETCAKDAACTKSGCANQGMGCMPVGPESIMKPMETCGKIKAEASCTGDCQYSTNEKECMPSSDKMTEACGWSSPTAAHSGPQLSPLRALLLSVATLLVRY